MKVPFAMVRPVACAASNVLLAGLLAFLAGCASGPRAASATDKAQFTVSLPEVKLAPAEYIQEMKVEVRYGRIVSVNRLLDDWDSAVSWDNPELVTVSGQARHFSSGLPDTTALREFITIESSSDEVPVRITAKLGTSCCTPTGRPDRQLAIGATEMILKPVSGRKEIK